MTGYFLLASGATPDIVGEASSIFPSLAAPLTMVAFIVAIAGLAAREWNKGRTIGLEQQRGRAERAEKALVEQAAENEKETNKLRDQITALEAKLDLRDDAHTKQIEEVRREFGEKLDALHKLRSEDQRLHREQLNKERLTAQTDFDALYQQYLSERNRSRAFKTQLIDAALVVIEPAPLNTDNV